MLAVKKGGMLALAVAKIKSEPIIFRGHPLPLSVCYYIKWPMAFVALMGNFV